MNSIETAQTVASVWFIVYFGLCLLAPVFGCASRRLTSKLTATNTKTRGK